MSSDPVIQKKFISFFNMWLERQGRRFSREELYIEARKLAPVFGYDGEFDNVVVEAELSITTTMGSGVTLYDESANHDKDWVFKRDNEITWTYSDAYEEYLKRENWPPQVVNKVSEVGKTILGYLQDPESEGKWDRRGLVIGNVQSGKTANYLGLIGKAADAKYRLIIVIAGIQNSLRKQTQERIDAGFIGRSSDPTSKREIIGVGRLSKDFPSPVTLTNIHSDFNKALAKDVSAKLDDFSKPVILVIKKNVHTLEALHDWLKDLNAEHHGRIVDVPMLMIDDEADHASINTAKPEHDPTKTNSWIRRILGLFDKSSFVGYTATPFANIFINPEAYEDDAMEKLFPRDFIYCLDAPNTYFGPEKVFSGEDGSSKFVKEINDAENYISFGHRITDTIFELPPSLYQAVRLFILSRAIRNMRGQESKHASMMVHVSRFVKIQGQVKDLVAFYVKELSEAIKANYKMPRPISSQNPFMSEMESAFISEYGDCEFSWEEVRKTLFSVFDHMRIYEINGSSGDSLDFSEYESSGFGLTAIAVGGNSLSRGLTIEGLTISYFYRNTRMYDTLMQMGRWFGYRPGYEDLCRVYLPKVSRSWYSHIAESTSELRLQIEQMRRDGLSPRQFGLYVKDHPTSLLVTAGNKMRSGERMTVSQNFSGKLVESILLPLDESTNEANYKRIEDCWDAGFGLGHDTLVKNAKGWHLNDVPTEKVIDFLKNFKVHPDFVERKTTVIRYYQKMEEIYKVSDVIFISNSKDRNENEGFYLGKQERRSGDFREDSQNGGPYWLAANHRVASRGDEKYGLTESQIIEAQAIHAERTPDSQMSDSYYREVRKKPLLVLHHLKLMETIEKKFDEKHYNTIVESAPAFGVSFPPGHYGTSVQVVANRVWIDLMHGNLPEVGESGDYDDE